MGERERAGRRGGGWVALALGLAAIAVAIAITVGTSRRPVYHATLTAGPLGTTRSLVARALVDAASAHGFDARLVETSATEDELERVNAGKVDFAMVAGTYRIKNYRHVREVMPLHVEALHLLVKEELAGAVGSTLGGLRGRTVDLGPPGSTTAAMAGAVMAFAGLSTRDAGTGNAYNARHLEQQEVEDLLARGDRAAMPDAVFHLATLPSKIARWLVRSGHYRLVPLPFADAFRLNALIEEGPGKGPAIEVDRGSVIDTVVPAYTYTMEPPLPAEPMHTLGSRLLLVANDRVPPGAVERMLDAVFSTRFAHVTYPPLDNSLLRLPPRLALHPGRVKYFENNLPILTNAKVDQINNTLGILGALVGAGWFLWQWWRQQMQARRDLVFGSYMQQVAGIERQAAELELSSALRLDPLIDLQRELLRLRSEALDRFGAGEIGGQAALSDLLGPINAARDHIGDLILHMREGMEEEAETEGKTAQEVWAEAIEKSEKHAEKSEER